jgi:hypothetical protein
VLVGVSLALACIVVALGFRAIRRRRRDVIRSVDHYHERLDTLHVEQHDRGGSVRVVDGAPACDEHPDPDRPRLDPQAARLASWDPTAPPQEQGRHDRTWALERMQSHARVDMGTVLIVAIVTIVLVAIAFAGYLIQRGRDSPTTTTTVHVAVPTSPPPARASPGANLHAPPHWSAPVLATIAVGAASTRWA